MEPSSTITFASSSSYLSNGSSPCSGLAPPGAAPSAAGEGWGGGSGSSMEAVSLNRLSNNLERLLLDPDLDCSDADVDVPDGGPPVSVHRCILAARSPFFYDLFAARGRGGAAAAGTEGAAEGGGSGRPRYKMEELVPGGRVGREAFQVFLGYLYTGKLRLAPPDVVSCADPVCPHDSCPPVIRFAVELMYAAWTFKIPELISLFQCTVHSTETCWRHWSHHSFLFILMDYCLLTIQMCLLFIQADYCLVQLFIRSAQTHITVHPGSIVDSCLFLLGLLFITRRLVNFVDKILVEDVIPILQVASHSELTQVLDKCIQRIARSDLDDISLDKELRPEVVDQIKKMRKKSETANGDAIISDPVHEKRVRRIHKALDSDDVELVKLLLNESEITLDDANALHYAASYCDSKVVTDLLDLGLTNLNLKNSRGYTPLHLAAMRREPAIIMCLLNKGAIVSLPTADGRSAISICRKLTRAKDFNTKLEQGQESNKDRLCIDILEREMMRNAMAVEDAVTSPLLADDLHMKLIYLENRVAFARLFFPAEAKVAMQIAQADTTEEFGGIAAASTSGKLREVDLNETPVTQNKRLRSRVDALMKTVELGRRYFPNCSQVLDKFLENNLPDGLDTFFLQKGTPDEQQVKRMRFCEIKEDVQKAFSKDKADNSMFSGLSSSLSCSPPQKVAKK